MWACIILLKDRNALKERNDFRGCVFSNHKKGMAEGHLGSWCPLRVLPLTPTHRRLSLECCRTRGNCTAAELNQFVFRDESRFKPAQ
ncbi:transposable element Tcb2 transposase [Trichonephila clavipes]|nr:transposable element Tcb2 transposase [Trichonephila clavipes]